MDSQRVRTAWWSASSCFLVLIGSVVPFRSALAGYCYGIDPCLCFPQSCPLCEGVSCEAPRSLKAVDTDYDGVADSCTCVCIPPGNCGSWNLDGCFENGEEWFRDGDCCVSQGPTPSFEVFEILDAVYPCYDARVQIRLSHPSFASHHYSAWPGLGFGLGITPPGFAFGQGMYSNQPLEEDLLHFAFNSCDVIPALAAQRSTTCFVDGDGKPKPVEPPSGPAHLLIRGRKVGMAMLDAYVEPNFSATDCHSGTTYHCEKLLGLSSIPFQIEAQSIVIPAMEVYEADATPMEIKIVPGVPPWQRGTVAFRVAVILPPEGPDGELGDAKLRFPGSPAPHCYRELRFLLGPCEDTLYFDLVGVRKTPPDPQHPLKLEISIGSPVELTPGVWDYPVKVEEEFEVEQGVDLIVPGQSEHDEDTKIIWLPLNNDFDEQNQDCGGTRVPDNTPHCDPVPAHRIAPDDDELRDAQIEFKGHHPLKWTTNGGILAWYNDGSKWLTTHNRWIDANPGDVVQLKLEGIALEDPCAWGGECVPTLTVTIKREQGCEEAADSSAIAVSGAVFGEVRLANGFLAIPDRSIYIDTGFRTLQQTRNDIDFEYYCTDLGVSECECSCLLGGSSRVEVWVRAQVVTPGSFDPPAELEVSLGSVAIPDPTRP